jgi:hypothetical protein
MLLLSEFSGSCMDEVKFIMEADSANLCGYRKYSRRGLAAWVMRALL